MKRLSRVVIALVALRGLASPFSAAESETATGTAARTGTYHRPLLLVDGKRYELKASDKAEASVTETLAKFSNGDTGTYVVKGTRDTVNGMDGILAGVVTPAAKPLPSTGATASGTNAAQGSVPPACAQNTPTVTSRVVTAGNRQYTIYDYTDPATKDYCMVIPDDLKTVRGILVDGNYYAGDSRGEWKIAYYQEFLRWHGFVFVGSGMTRPHNAALQGFRNCIRMVSVASRHPELVNAPYVATGLSAGGGFASTLMTREPDKTIAVGIVCARYNFDIFDPSKPSKPGDPPHQPPAGAFLDALLSIPSILITGEQEHLNDPDPNYPHPHKVDEVLVPYRPMGGELAWLEYQGHGHQYNENRQDLLTMPLLDLAVRTRYPKDADVTKGPIKLLRIDLASGWIADNNSWKSGLTKIVPAKQFKGDLGHSSWLQNEDLAFIYRAYATYDNPLTLTSPGLCDPGMPALDPGANVPIVVDAGKFPNWMKLEFYDGAKKLGTVTAAPARFAATNLTPGYHVFSVLGTDVQGTVRSSDPRMVVVRQPPTDVPGVRP